MNRLKQSIQKLFSFSYTEAKGYLILMITCMIAVITYYGSQSLMSNPSKLSERDSAIADSLYAILTDYQQIENKNVYFSFDPNHTSLDSLLLLGMEPQIANRIIKYRERNGRFLIKSDLTKIYGLTHEEFQVLAPHIQLPDSLSSSSPLNAPVDINFAVQNDLAALPEIGDVSARRIINYRTLLGGFTSKTQYQEVYGLSDAALNNLKKHSYINKGFQPDKIKINSADKDELSRHAYISYTLADDILLYRSINGRIDSEKVLAKFKSIDEDNFKNLILYLDFQ